MKSDKEAVSLMEEWAESNVCLMYYEPQKKLVYLISLVRSPASPPASSSSPQQQESSPPIFSSVSPLESAAATPPHWTHPNWLHPNSHTVPIWTPGVNTASRAHRNSYSRYVVFTIMKITRIVKPDE